MNAQMYGGKTLSNTETNIGLQVQLFSDKNYCTGQTRQSYTHIYSNKSEWCMSNNSVRKSVLTAQVLDKTQIYTDIIAIDSDLQLHINSYKNNLTLHKMSSQQRSK